MGLWHLYEPTSTRRAAGRRVALFVVRVGCFLAGLFGWLFITVISVHFLTTDLPTASVNSTTGDPELTWHTFELGSNGSSSLLSIPVNDYTKILVAGVFIAATLGFAFLACFVFGQKREQRD